MVVSCFAARVIGFLTMFDIELLFAAVLLHCITFILLNEAGYLGFANSANGVFKYRSENRNSWHPEKSAPS